MVGKTHLAVAIGRQVILAGYTVLFLPTLVTQLAKAHGLVSRRYEWGSMLITSNHSIGEWGTVFGDAVAATAILDRRLHHSHVITIRGDSYRLREKRSTGLLKAP